MLTGQVALADAVDDAPSHWLLPRAVTVEVMLQLFKSRGTMKLPEKFMLAPGAKITGPNTGLFALGRFTTTVALVKVIIPVLVIFPVNTSGLPGAVGVEGQSRVTAIDGADVRGHVWVTLSLIVLPAQLSVAETLNTTVLEQASNGAV